MYYTYAFLREDGTPYYIGKGKGNRMYVRSRRVKRPDDKSKIIKLKDNLTEEEAYRHEKYMISVLGRKDKGTGILRNMTDGGEGDSGRIIGEAQRKAISISNSRRPQSGELRLKKSLAQKGVKKTKEHAANISAGMKGRKRGPYKKRSK